MNNVFAFEWCGCIYESGFSLVTLHDTKRGALKAMIATANSRWQESRNGQLMYGAGGKERFDPLQYEAWRVRAIELHNAKSQATDAALSRQVACTDGLCGNGSEVGAGETVKKGQK